MTLPQVLEGRRGTGISRAPLKMLLIICLQIVYIYMKVRFLMVVVILLQLIVITIWSMVLKQLPVSIIKVKVGYSVYGMGWIKPDMIQSITQAQQINGLIIHHGTLQQRKEMKLKISEYMALLLEDWEYLGTLATFGSNMVLFYYKHIKESVEW